MTVYRAVDCQSFAGGFTLGMVQAGFALIGKREHPGGFGVPNCEANRHLLGDGWQAQATIPSEWDVPSGGCDVVFGNPPCSGFSVMSAQGFRGANSKVNQCMWDFASYVIRARPRVAVFESVQQAYRSIDGANLMRQLRAYVEAETQQSWTLYHVLHNAYSIGGAAQRKRYFWLISRVPFGIEREIPDHLPEFNDIIRDLAPLANSWYPQAYRHAPSRWVTRENVRSIDGSVDGHATVSTPNTRRMHDLINGVSWNPGESISTVTRRYWDTYAKLPDSFADTEEKIVKKDFHMGFTTPVRWNGNNPARVLTGGALIMVLHPWLDRMITHREAARVMGFPDDWLIAPLRRQGMKLGQTWGKGITVQCGRWIGGWIRRALDENPGTYTGSQQGEREYTIDVTHDWKHCM